MTMEKEKKQELLKSFMKYQKYFIKSKKALQKFCYFKY
jgi:hypothetical protein